MSRARSRFAALSAALPLFVAGGPVLTAVAVDGPVSQATMVQTLGDFRVGPNAGFRGDVARGVSGTTAVMKVDVSPSAVINTVVVRVTMDKAFSIYQHFNSNDGFAVYKDTDGDGLLDVAEHAAGPVTNPGYSVTGDNGAAVVTMTTDAAKATGEDDYLITVHPAANPVADRAVTFTVPIGGLQTSAGNLPLSSFSTSDIVIDSLAPALIPAENFTPVNRKPTAFCPPGAAADECGEDEYKIFRGATPAEDGAKIGFYNAPGDVSDAALLIADPAGESTPARLAVYDLNTIPALEADKAPFDIGNGTGRDASVAGSKALNNQISDDVVVAQWDLMGNLASHTFTNNNCVANPTTCPAPLTPRGNDVTGPKTTTFTVAMNNINANAGSTPAAHPVTGTMSGVDSAKPANRAETPVRMVANLHRLSDQDTSLFTGAQAWSAAVTPASGNVVATSNVDASSDENYPSPSRVRAAAVLVDTTGNPSVGANSPVRYRDLVKPRFASFSLLDANANGIPEKDEFYRVVFDDALDTSKVTSANVQSQLLPDNGTATCDRGPTNITGDCPWWGEGATISWPDTRTLLIKLGEPDSGCPGNHLTCRLAVAGDEVNASTNTTTGVLDLAGNVIENTPFTIQNPFVQESSATTIDAAALSAPAVFGTGRDGILEAIDVTFTGPITKSTITEASDAGKFTVSVPGGTTLTASAVGLGGGSTSTVARLSFTPPAEEWALWGTAATPIVKLTDSTIVKSGAQAVLAFTIAAADGAAPVPVSMTTQDTGAANGQIDKILVKYSENVVPLAENECGYTVTSYGDSAYIPPSAGPTQGTCPGTSAGPPTQYRTPFAAVAGQPDTVALTLKPLTTPDTNATPVVSFNAGNQVPAYGPSSDPEDEGIAAPDCNPTPSLTAASVPNCPVVDASENGLASFTGTSTDGAGPAILTRTTADTDSDGHLDAINVTYSESLSTPTVGAAQFQVTEPAYTVFRVDQSGDTSIKITLVPGTGAGDTSVKPKLQSTAAAPSDTSDSANPSPVDAAGLVTVDKAGPAIMGACISTTVPAETPPAEKTARLGNCPEGAGDKIAVLFSEALDTTAGVVALADFVVEQPAGTAKTVGTVSAPANASDGKSSIVTLTMAANNNLDNTKDAFVKLAAASAVNDNATPTKNPSVQTALIAAWGPPVVTLDVTCPVAATPGHCSADYVNTGAAGTPGVIGWRLVDQAAAPPLPAAGDFSATQPTRFPAEGTITEGTHTFWLRGRDAFNRISAEVTASVTVYKRPEILAVQMVNSTDRTRPGTWSRTTTVLDGDAILIGAEAYGTDAAQWAANSAPTGGGCLAQHMSIDVRKLSGRSTDGAVRPTKCDLKTGTERPYRQMQFPVIRAGGTTKYPVGTVLKVTDTDPGSMIVDGPGGTIRRRQFISVGARRSWMISDASVIKVPTALVNAIPKTTSMKYRNGALLRSSTGYYYMYEGLKRPVSAAQLSAWRMSTSTAYRPTTAELRLIPTGSRITGTAHAAGTWIKYSDGRIYQVVRNKNGVAVRRKLASSSALRTLVPTSHIYPANSNDSKLAVDTWLRGYRDGTLLKLSGGTFGVIARGSLRRFANSATFNTLGYATSTALTPNGAAMPRVTGQTYRTGTSIDRYKFSSVVIKVTNKAGGIDTEVVLPSLGGIYGVGTIDPVPMGWDTTR